MVVRKQRGAKSKAKIALEAVKGEETMSSIGKRHGVHPIQVGKWKKELLSRAYELFADRRFKKSSPDESTIKELYEQIGRLKVENDFLKKTHDLSNRGKKALIEEDHPFLSVAQQCRLLGL